MTEAINLFTISTLASVTVSWSGLGLQGPGHISRCFHGCQRVSWCETSTGLKPNVVHDLSVPEQASSVLSLSCGALWAFLQSVSNARASLLPR